MFNHSDLVCKHCRQLDNKANADLLLRVLNEFQLFVGHHRLVLNSVYRCKEYNRIVYLRLFRTALAEGRITKKRVFVKADSSQHILCLAFDLGCNGYSAKELYDKAVEFSKFQAIGIYNSFIHADIRKISLITWDNRSKKRREAHPLTSS